MTPALTLVTDAPETAAQRAAKRHAEAQELTRTAVYEMLASAAATNAGALAIAHLATAEPGVREECRQISAYLVAKADTVMAILGRGR